MATCAHGDAHSKLETTMPLHKLAVGVDLVCVDDVARSVESFGDRYLSRVYTPSELGQTGGSAPRLAARFAAKEAVYKALGGDDDALPWSEIEIIGRPSGNPEVRLGPAAARLADRAGIGSWAVSMSHEAGMAAAVAVGWTEIPAGGRLEEL
jgi:holo-[acyl-carrier protein] synthase